MSDVVAKPNELLALHGVTEELFDTLRRWFGVPAAVPLNLSDIDAAVTELGDPVLIAAMAMRKLQALRLLSTPGVRTTTDVVVTIVQDLDRALVQAPNMRLNLAASSTDWDAAFAQLTERGDHDPDDGAGPSADDGAGAGAGSETASSTTPSGVDDEDPEATRFRELHGRLHEAVFAVMEASDGEIRYFE